MTTTRAGGVSKPPYDQLNLADHVGDQLENVISNRKILVNQLSLPGEPKWLKQVHGHNVVNASNIISGLAQADASFTVDANIVCTVMTADCLPIALADSQGECIGVVHAGWRGLLGGVIQKAIVAMSQFSKPEYAWLGPALSPDAFEVEADVYHAYLTENKQFAQAFAIKNSNKWSFDIYQAAKMILMSEGVNQVFGGQHCTYGDSEQFYSYRRDGVTGRMATLIWKSQK
ncbi:MAG: peptidoglycan editing factor PgeF [Pseudomonadota bacterium]